MFAHPNRKCPGGTAYILFLAGTGDEIHYKFRTASAERFYGVSPSCSSGSKLCHFACPNGIMLTHYTLPAGKEARPVMKEQGASRRIYNIRGYPTL